MRAVRVDKTCLMVLERTLQMFRDPARLRREHPTYRMICATPEVLRARGEELIRLLAQQAPRLGAELGPSSAFLGSGSLPTEAIPSLELKVTAPNLSAAELSRRLRLDEACVFGRIEDDVVRLDLRTVADEHMPAIAAALRRATA
jgi:L-seryl-tRNA(Ser) seleniumtransferase